MKEIDLNTIKIVCYMPAYNAEHLMEPVIRGIHISADEDGYWKDKQREQVS